MDQTELKIEDWGLVDYQEAFERQTDMVQRLLAGEGRDTLVLVEHPQTVTLGRRASDADLHFPESIYADKGVTLQKINRGGLATAHEPGQLVAYPVHRLKKHDLRWYADQFLRVVIAVLAEYDIEGRLKQGEPGVWVEGRKICSFGIALKKWITSHGIALNVNNSLETFGMIVPCGRPAEIVTSLAHEIGGEVEMESLKGHFVRHYCEQFDYRPLES